jgi:hypothetical protein
MTADQLIVELFVNHWLAMTWFAPFLTFIYAWVTDQTAWWMCSLFMCFAYVIFAKSGK